ncbi:MAG: HD domain-containing protein [Paludibacteraceae bacterium]|nr:HD domain-containing protein [Paludibacteraceae bacterium]
MYNKRKIINDPVHGFISIPSELHYDLIQHPYFQRLGRIKQLGMSYLVYPGAQHTRFQHSLGAMYLMEEAIAQLRSRGNEITDEEADAVLAAILLHDIGHAPFSHVLENTLTQEISHEEISLLMMEQINKEMGGALEMAMQIYQNTYPKRFLHQLVSSQLDMDRLDYLIRDSFFTGVVEGAVGAARIIKMLNVHDDQLVVEAKGVYSIEKFLIARRMMYWQVYYHKTSVSAEQVLIKTLERAKELTSKGKSLFASPQFEFFLKNNISKNDFLTSEEPLINYAKFDDSDIISAVKTWSTGEDKVLATLCRNLMNRKLFKIEVREKKPLNAEVRDYVKHVADRLGLSEADARYFVTIHPVSSYTYRPKNDSIKVLYGDGELKDITDSSDLLNLSLISKHEKKYYFGYVKECDLL